MYTYLILDFVTIAIPLAFSFESRVRYYRKWKYVVAASFLAGVPFLLWDEFFAAAGVWGFNPAYLLGIYVGHLPLEEILFFLFIPFSCVFIYEVLGAFLSDRTARPVRHPVRRSPVHAHNRIGCVRAAHPSRIPAEKRISQTLFSYVRDQHCALFSCQRDPYQRHPCRRSRPRSLVSRLGNDRITCYGHSGGRFLLFVRVASLGRDDL